ncbi:MAG: c-type cytochrome biogenesis protein CcmI [Rhizobiaceae bacterium]
MLFWIFALLMMCVAILCVLLPLARKQTQAPDAANSMDVYIEQLAEIDGRKPQSDEEREAIEQERAELSRRILKQGRTGNTSPETSSSGSRNMVMASLIALVCLPALAMGTYFYTGSPSVPDHPLTARLNQDLSKSSVEEMVLMVERHLASNPDDAKGWSVLAGVYGRLNRPNDRARALQELIRLAGPSPERLTDLGEALTVAQQNIVPARARLMFEQALREKPDHSKAELYLAIAEEQEGKLEPSLQRWQKLALIRTDDQRWQAMVAQKIGELNAKLGRPAPPALAGPTAEDIENAASLSQSDRQGMILSMVEGLASKLEDEPNDLPGWTRLIRSYSVLGERQKALAAYTKAKTVFADQPASVASLDSQASQLGLVEPAPNSAPQEGERP